MPNLPTSKLTKIFTILSLLTSNSLHGLEADKAKDVQWSADGDSTMSIQHGLRVLEMSDNVKVTQGTLTISGERAIFEYDLSSNELNKVTVHGTPVQYRQELEEEGGVVTGSSETISFYTDELDSQTIIELTGNAFIQSPDSTMKCKSIVYLADRDLIREAAGPCEGMLSPSSN